MSENTPDREALDAAGRLTDALAKTAAEVSALRRYGRHNRWFIAFDIVLTVLLTLSGGIAVHAVQTATRADSAQLALCRAGNTARAQQAELWDYLISLSKPPRTAQGRRLVGEFEHHLRVVFAPRDCARLGQGR